MQHPLDGIREKLTRAQYHIDVLHDEWSTFFNTESNSPILDHSRDGHWHIISVNAPLKKSPPVRFGIICGDAIHNLRCALDHLVWQLVLAQGNTPINKNCFPIYTREKDFKGRVIVPGKRKKPNPLSGINPDSEPWTRIHALQPYHRRKKGEDPSRDRLVALATLSNIDKHRTIYINMLFPEPGLDNLINYDRTAILLEQQATIQPLSLEQQTELVRVRFDPAAPDPNVRVKNRIAVAPTFGDSNWQMDLGTVKLIHGRVSTIIDDFSEFF